MLCNLLILSVARSNIATNYARDTTTTPEAEIWRWVDAPALLGDEDLGVSEFVKIFQLEVEEMMSSYPSPGADDGTPPLLKRDMFARVLLREG